MPDDDDIALSEKRVHEARREATRAYVASGEPRAQRVAPDERAGAEGVERSESPESEERHASSGGGVAYVDASDDQIGRFGLEHQCTARDVAGGDGQLLVATDADVLVGGEESFESTGFGPAVAVAVGTDLLAAGPDGRVARLVGGEWETVGRVDDVRAMDGDLVAGDDGVYRLGEDGRALTRDGLDGVRDVAAAGPLAATDAGVYRHDGEWNLALEGAATVVAGERHRESGDGERAHAVVDGTLVERVDGEWRDAAAPDGEVVDVAYDRGAFAVTADGRVLLDPVTAKDGSPEWRSRSLGLTDVVGIAIP